VLAGLAAEGETVISGVEHIARGHEDLCGKLVALGASVGNRNASMETAAGEDRFS
jgi:UDP-N-acetylglucosamine 1-carboxyvinyltransferase